MGRVALAPQVHGVDLPRRQKGTKVLIRIKIAWCKLRNERWILLRHGGRSFALTVPRIADGHFNGHMHPLPQLQGTRLGMAGRPIKASAYLDFAIVSNRIGKFQGIAIPSEYHRQGWAADMVRALLAHYPNVHFYNSSLNEMSGPLFMARYSYSCP